MKSLDMFCASQTATAICMSLEQHVVSSSTATIHLGSAHHHPINDDGSRRSVSSARGTIKRPASSTSSIASSQQSPNPGRKSNYSKLENNTQEKKPSDVATVRRSSASLVDAVRNSSCMKPSAYFTPPGSKRYLLAENQSYPRSDRILALVPTETKNVTDTKDSGKPVVSAASSKNEAPLFVPASEKCCSLLRSNSNKVVVVRVSLHCKGCAGKVKKHISRMQGVTSFIVDFDAKRVTVFGDVTQLEVLASISKVRTAQLLPLIMPNPTPAPWTNNAKQVLGELIRQEKAETASLPHSV